MSEPFQEQIEGRPGVRGFLHWVEASATGLVLTHGAGGNCHSPLLIALADAICAKGLTVLRCDLPFRQKRPHGPPLGTALEDQSGLRSATKTLRERVKGKVFLGGHSYGGRMATMLAAEDCSVASGLLLLSYPLHPPRKPQQLRTAHFPKLQVRALFVHGTRDPFGSISEMESALPLIPAETKLLAIESAGHELVVKRTLDSVASMVADSFLEWLVGR